MHIISKKCKKKRRQYFTKYQKGTKSLKEYYFTNEGNKIGISLDDPIKKDKKYIDDIINKVSNEGYSNEVLKQYIKHLIPVLFFFNYFTFIPSLAG